MTHKKMKNLPQSERPYEKYLSSGPQALSDADLLAIVLQNGTPHQSALDIARDLLSYGHGNLLNLYDLSFEDMQKFDGVGRVKAIQLKAIAELSARIAKTQHAERMQMNSPSTIADYYMERMRHLKEEHLFCVFFDHKCAFLGEKEISIGTVDHVMTCQREILCSAFDKGAVSIVVLHNHPGGDPSPSEEDKTATATLRESCRICGLNLSDHIIIGDNCYYSFFENKEESL